MSSQNCFFTNNSNRDLPANILRVNNNVNSASLLLVVFCSQGGRARGIWKEGSLFIAQRYSTLKSKSLRQAQSSKVSRTTDHRLLSRYGAQHRLDKRGIYGNVFPSILAELASFTSVESSLTDGASRFIHFDFFETSVFTNFWFLIIYFTDLRRWYISCSELARFEAQTTGKYVWGI